MGLGTLGVPLVDDLNALVPKIDLLFEFTVPEASLAHVRTGRPWQNRWSWAPPASSPRSWRRFATLSQHMPLFMAPNMSPLLTSCMLIADAARLLGTDFDIETRGASSV